MLEATPGPEPVETSLPVDVQPTVVTVNGAAAAVVPAPADATTAEVKAVAEQSAENLKAVASGEVSLAEGTRNLADSPDGGEGNGFWIAAPFIGLMLRRILDPLIRKSRMSDDWMGAAHGLLMVGLATLGWVWLASHYQSLPQDWMSWFNAAGSATLGGVLGSTRTQSALGGAPVTP